MRKPVLFLVLTVISIAATGVLATLNLATASMGAETGLEIKDSPVTSEDEAARRRAHLEKAFETADVFPGATVEDFLYPEPDEEKPLFAPQYEPWVEVFRFPIIQSLYAVGVAYSKNADEDIRYIVSTGINPRPIIRFYNKDGEQTRTCDQQNSTGWGLRDLAYDESRNEFHGGGHQVYKRQIFLDNCRDKCDVYLPQLPYQYGTAHHDVDGGPDTVWANYWQDDFRGFAISRPSCAFESLGTLMSNGRGALYGIAIDQSGATGEPWVLWISYQSGPGGVRLEARRRDGTVLGYQSIQLILGGIDFTDDWEGTGKPALICVAQGNPDRVVVLQPPETGVADVHKDEKHVIFLLSQNKPNPFARTTTLSFNLPVSGHATLSIYDMCGRLITTLLDEETDAGFHSLTWHREEAASGIYFYRLGWNGHSLTRKMLVVR